MKCHYCEQPSNPVKSHMCGSELVQICDDCWVTAAMIQGARESGQCILTTYQGSKVIVTSVGAREALERTAQALKVAGFEVELHDPIQMAKLAG